MIKILNSYDKSLEQFYENMQEVINEPILVQQFNKVDEHVLKIIHSENNIQLNSLYSDELSYSFDNMRLNLKYNLYEDIHGFIQNLENILFELNGLNYEVSQIKTLSLDLDTIVEVTELSIILRKLLMKFEIYLNTTLLLEVAR